jgi:hypothetical protein
MQDSGIPRPPAALNAPIYHSIMPPRSRSVELAEQAIKTILAIAVFVFLARFTSLSEKIVSDPRVNRKFLLVFWLCLGGFLVTYGYGWLTLRFLPRREERVPVDDWERRAPGVVYGGYGCLSVAGIAFVFALWPCFGAVTLAIGASGFFAALGVLSWIPL